MKKNIIISCLLIFTIGTFGACSSGSSTATSSDSVQVEDPTQTVEAGNPEFKDEKTASAYQHYIHLKTSLVKSDANEAKSASSALNAALLNAGNTEGADLAAKITSTTDLAIQRSYFEALTEQVEATVKKSGLKSGKIFKQFCPMANNGDGGYWLANESAIENPYYGDEMLACGEVKEEIK